MNIMILNVLYEFKYHILVHFIILSSAIIILVVGCETNAFNWIDTDLTLEKIIKEW